jgi:hypothetical protein
MITIDILLFFGLEVHGRTMSYHGSIESTQLSIRIIEFVLFRWKQVISGATLISILLLNCFITMNFRKMEI